MLFVKNCFCSTFTWELLSHRNKSSRDRSTNCLLQSTLCDKLYFHPSPSVLPFISQSQAMPFSATRRTVFVDCWCQSVFRWSLCGVFCFCLRGAGVLEIPICVKMSIMWEKARSALWCISLIYYLTDFQALILSTLEEVGTPLPPFHTWHHGWFKRCLDGLQNYTYSGAFEFLPKKLFQLKNQDDRL